MGAYAQGLSRIAEAPDLAIDQFLQAVAMEKSLDFPAVERERQTVIEKIVAQSDGNRALKDLIDKKSFSVQAPVNIGFRRLLSRVAAALRTQGNHGYRKRARSTISAFATRCSLDGTARPTRCSKRWTAGGNPSSNSRSRPRARRKDAVQQSESLALARKLVDFSLTSREWEKYRKSAHDDRLKKF